MIKIIPAILEKNFEELSGKLSLLRGAVSTVQLDICDGSFVPSVSWPYTSSVHPDEPLDYDENFQMMLAQGAEMPFWQDFDYELDLMVSDAKWLLPDLMSIGPSKIIFHAETFDDLFSDMSELKSMIPGIVDIGIAINPDTDPEIIYPLIEERIISFVQCMGIQKIGFQGEPFDERVIHNLKTLREKYPDVPLSVDGGVSPATLPELAAAGASSLVAGSSIWSKDNPLSAIVDLRTLPAAHQ